MIKKITIKNYKSILNLSIELGRFNVFIGENGCGKTNILEAVAMFSGAENDRLRMEDLANQGIRVARPDLTYSSFFNQKAKKRITYQCHLETADTVQEIDTKINLNDKNEWVADNDFSSKIMENFWKENPKVLTFKEYTNIINRIISNSQALAAYTKNYVIYDLNTQALRGITKESLREPLGIYGENLDTALANIGQDILKKIEEYKYIIPWLKDIIIDSKGKYKQQGYNPKGNSTLYFSDKFMKSESVFNVENANEGILHLLFYLVLFTHPNSPRFFAIDNIETALNPHLCRHISEILSTINPHKQALVTTHNPAILDGLDLTNDTIRLFAVKRNDKGHTTCQRIQYRKGVDTKKYKLSEMWMKGLLGAIPEKF